MKNKKVIIILAIIVLSVFSFAIWNTMNNDQENKNINYNADIEELLKINTTLEMNDMQETIYDEAKNKLMENPSDYEALLSLARMKQDLLDSEGAIEIYQKMMEMKSDDILPLNNLGTIYYNQKEYEKAEEMHLTILEITPKWITSYRELSNIYRYHLKEKATELEPILLSGMEKYPEMKNDFIGLLTIYYDEIVPDREKAIEYYEKLIAIYPENDNLKERLNELKSEK